MSGVLLQAFGGGYYRGGFEPKMNKREAALVLGVRYGHCTHTSIPPPTEIQQLQFPVLPMWCIDEWLWYCAARCWSFSVFVLLYSQNKSIATNIDQNNSIALSCSPTANRNKIREAHRKLMILNHPDRGEKKKSVSKALQKEAVGYNKLLNLHYIHITPLLSSVTLLGRGDLSPKINAQ